MVVIGVKSGSHGIVVAICGGGPPGVGMVSRFGDGSPEDDGASRNGGFSPVRETAGVSAGSSGPIWRIGLCGGSDGSPIAFSAMVGCTRGQRVKGLRICCHTNGRSRNYKTQADDKAGNQRRNSQRSNFPHMDRQPSNGEEKRW
ncbi:unnamed protein product [Lactuca virosa]|uniref:Uncharacterized protein n=1 Tax=Lactuca virosa TaxID=75947 RepID=A0AAU9LBN9_9ASTR|nr:unnamed protein product [Lactuca virosa]